MTEHDFDSRKYTLVKTNKLIPYIATFDCDAGRRELSSVLADAPSPAVKWNFQTTLGDVECNRFMGAEFTSINFYERKN
mgnify:CR=1 FL=1